MRSTEHSFGAFYSKTRPAESISHNIPNEMVNGVGGEGIERFGGACRTQNCGMSTAGVRSGGRALSSRQDGGGVGLGRGSQGQATDQVHGNDEQGEGQYRTVSGP